MAYTVMAYVIMALHRYRLDSYGLDSYGLDSYGLDSYGLLVCIDNSLDEERKVACAVMALIVLYSYGPTS